MLVDTLGWVLRILMHPADVPDQEGGQWLLAASAELTEACPRLQQLWADTAAYHDRFVAWVRETLGWRVPVVQRPARWCWMPADQEPPPVPKGFQVLPRRWVVARTFGWLGRWRRTARAYTSLPATSACVVELVMVRIMLRRLAESPA